MLIRDLRYAVRMLWRNPALALAAAGSLALAIGGSTAVFTLLNAIVLRALPIQEPDRVFQALRLNTGEPAPILAWPAIVRAREALAGKAEIAAASSIAGMQLQPQGRDAAHADRGTVQLVSGEYFELVRQQPQRGRLLAPSDNVTVGAHPVAVISDGYWRRQLARRDDAVGTTLAINGTLFTIVGIAAPQFFGTTLSTRSPDAWVPLVMQPSVRYAMNASSHNNGDTRLPWPPQEEIEWLNVFVRVPRDTEPSAIAAALTVQRQREADLVFGAADSGDTRDAVRRERIALEPAARGLSSLRDSVSSPLYVLLAMMGVLLAIACGNVAGLLVARASAREREVAIRLSIGAARFQLFRQMLVEGVVLGAVGGAAGLLLAFWGRTALLKLFAASATLITLDTDFDWRVLSFALAVSLVTGLACGLIPAIRGSRTSLAGALNASSRGAGGARRSFLVGKALVALQMAFCLLALVVAGLFVRSLRTLTSMDIGYDRDAHVLTARLDVRSLGYDPGQRQALYDRLLARVQALPGVQSASLSLNGPLANSTRSSSFGIEGHEPAEGERLITQEEMVTEDHFATVGLQILEGRGFLPEDRTAGARNTIVNRTVARKFFKNGTAVGKRWTYGGPIDADAFVIVGVVEDARYVEIRKSTPNMVYHLAAARPDEVLGNMEIRTAGGVAAATIRQAAAEAEPQLPIFDIVPLSDRVARVLSQETLVARLTSIFSILALLLACLGLYGTISYGINRRIPEIGVRMALGADRPVVIRMILREALVLVAAGAAAGVPLALLAGRAVRTMLYQIQPVDPLVFGVCVVLLLVVATIAALVPARRASRIEPTAALTRT